MRTSAPAASLLLLGVLLAAPARAEITIESSEFFIDVFAGIDQNGDGAIFDDEADLDEVDRFGVLSFSETLEASTRKSQASSSQTSNISAAATTLSLVSNGSCGGSSDQGAESTQGDGSGRFELRVTLTARTRLSITGSVHGSGAGGRAAFGGPFTSHEVIDSTENIGDDVVLDPGTYSLGALCNADSHFDSVGGPGPAASTSGWSLNVTLTEGEGECQEELITWVGGPAGAFDRAENWDPPTVPVFDEDQHCGSAVFRGGRDVVIDLGATPAAAALGAAVVAPVPIHRVNHLVIDSTQRLHPKDGTIEADELSPVAGERSLEVLNGATLVLDNGGVLARHAALGARGEGAIEVVGLRGLLATTGRLGLGLESSGSLLVSDGATVSAAEAVLGEENAQGSVTVQGAASTLDTGNIAVGLEDDGFLVIEEGGQVTSEAGVIGFDLDGAERGRAEVLGTAPGGAPSRWALHSLDVRPNGSLSVEGGARVEIAGPLRIGGEGAEADCLQKRACVNITEGFMNAEGVAVGNGGGGRLEILPNGALAAAGEFTIAPDEDTRAFVVINGPSADASVFTDLAIATGERATGGLELRNGARLDLIGRFRIGGPDDSTGGLQLIGDAARPDDTLLTVFEGDAFDSLVGDGTTEPPDALVPASGFLTIENARLELSGANHGLAIQRDGRLEAHNAQISVESPAGLVNRGRIVGDLIVEGNYVQEATGTLNGTLLTTPGPVVTPTSLLRAAAAPPPPPFHPFVVTGNATLAGKVKLQFGNGVAPKQGDSFELLDVQGNVTGAFDEIEIAGLAPGFDFDGGIVNGAFVLTSQNDAQPLPFVNLAGKPTLVETKKGAKVKVTRTGDTTAPLDVAYTVSGTATSGVDYVALPGTVHFPAGKKATTLLVQPIADTLTEGSETIELELAPDASFAPSLTSQLTIELLDGKAKK